MACFHADQPPNRDYAAETRSTLEAQIELNPRLASSNLEALNRMLFGSGGQPGTVETFANTVAPALSRATATANTAQRTADIGDVANLGPQARAAILGANPDNARILDLLNQGAIGGLEAGTSMTDAEARQVQQASRAAFAARGTSGGNASIADELLQQFNMGQALQDQRRNFALRALGANQTIFDPMMALTGRQSGVVQGAPAWSNQGLEAANIYNPESAYSGNVYNSNQQMAAMFADPSTIEKAGAISGIAGKFIGSVAGAMV